MPSLRPNVKSRRTCWMRGSLFCQTFVRGVWNAGRKKESGIRNSTWDKPLNWFGKLNWSIGLIRKVKVLEVSFLLLRRHPTPKLHRLPAFHPWKKSFEENTVKSPYPVKCKLMPWDWQMKRTSLATSSVREVLKRHDAK